jgi:proteasome lid subunit RPN8/RPN11
LRLRGIAVLALLISEQLKGQISQAGTAAYPYECCGLMLGRILPSHDPDQDDGQMQDDRQVIELVPADNRWDTSVQEVTDPAEESSSSAGQALDQHRRYWIDPEMMLRVQRKARDRNLDIIGVYHSHPDHPAIPSECDRRLAWPVYSYVIVSVQAGKAVDFQSWRLDEQHQFQAEAAKIVDKICT